MSMYGKAYAPLDCGTESRTKQSMAAECDINLIMARFEVTGLVSHVSAGVPHFADVSAVGDYRTALENVRAVDEYFAGLPAKVRARFSHDSAEFMEYLESGASEEELRVLGLEALGDRRADLSRRESDVETPPVAPEEPREASGTVPS